MKRPLTVMKFGGTSVADAEKIARAAERAVRAHRRGRRVVVVVSAPGAMTDELEALAATVAPAPERRELDRLMATGEEVAIALMALALRARGVAAVSLSGAQAGIVTDGRHGRGQITRIRTRRIEAELAARRVVVVAGFQGVGPGDDVVTLGRGGSDLTAVALSAALGADGAEIYTDVRGVYTADPRVVPEARKIHRLSCAQMLELAGAGAQVMLPRSIEVARRYGVALQVRSSFHPDRGTWVVPEEKKMESAFVSSLALDKTGVKFALVGLPDRPGVAAKVLSALAAADVPVETIVQSSSPSEGVNHMALLVPRAERKRAAAALDGAARTLRGVRVEEDDRVAVVSVVGTGFKRHPWVAARVFETLAKARINLQMISTSDLKVALVVDLAHGDRAIRALHAAFGLAKSRH